MQILKPNWLVLAGCLGGISSCAGPTTPLGAVWAITPTQAHHASFNASDASAPDGPIIHFTPSRQVLHGPSLMRISIEDHPSDLSHYDIAIRYNGLDVTSSFLRGAKIDPEPDRGRLTIESTTLHLSAVEEHQIEVLYRNASGRIAYSRYDSPECEIFKPQAVRNLASFSPSPGLIRLIEKISQDKNVNPAFSTGLIAQESAFNPHAISWAKAVGLTQVTPLAEQEILRTNPGWPTFPEFNQKTVPAMKALILSGKVNAKNEWRLSPERSIEGGIDYAILLARLWNTPENIARIRAVFPNVESVKTQLVLASYHSGYTRVLTALQTQGPRWIYSPELVEARKYVNRILSYCSYFTEKEFDYENPT